MGELERKEEMRYSMRGVSAGLMAIQIRMRPTCTPTKLLRVAKEGEGAFTAFHEAQGRKIASSSRVVR